MLVCYLEFIIPSKNRICVVSKSELLFTSYDSGFILTKGANFSKEIIFEILVLCFFKTRARNLQLLNNEAVGIFLSDQ